MKSNLCRENEYGRLGGNDEVISLLDKNKESGFTKRFYTEAHLVFCTKRHRPLPRRVYGSEGRQGIVVPT